MKYLFEIQIKEGHTLEEYVEKWKAGSALIQKHPGARGTRLFKKIGEPNRLLAIAEWDSKEARDAAMDTLAKADPETQRIWKEHNEVGKLIKIGAFDETDWEVLPD